MDIAFRGIGSGVQVSEIVEAIVGAERAPFESSLNRRQASLTTDISAVGTLRGGIQSIADAIEDLASADKYQQKTISGTDTHVSLTSTKDAEVGNYSVKVDQLASAHKLVSTGINETDAVGEGTLSFTSGTNTFDISVSDTATLNDIRNAINDSTDNESITATIINDDTGQHLVLTSRETGLANAIKVTADDVSDGSDTDNAGLSRLVYDPDALPTAITNLSQTTAAADAQITIDGNLIATNSTNEFVNVIDGVTVTAKKEHDTGDTSNIGLTANNNNIKTGLENFVKSYNEFIDLTTQLGRASSEGAGPLAGDSLLRGVVGKIRQELSSSFASVGSDTLSLNQLGVHTDRYGKLSLDSDELDEQIQKGTVGIENFFIGSDETPGFAASLQTLTELYTESDGLIQGRIDSKNSQLDKLDDERINFSRRIDALEDRLYAQYNAMDLLVSNLNTTSTYLQQQLDNMPGVVRQSNN